MRRRFARDRSRDRVEEEISAWREATKDTTSYRIWKHAVTLAAVRKGADGELIRKNERIREILHRAFNYGEPVWMAADEVAFVAKAIAKPRKEVGWMIRAPRRDRRRMIRGTTHLRQSRRSRDVPTISYADNARRDRLLANRIRDAYDAGASAEQTGRTLAREESRAIGRGRAIDFDRVRRAVRDLASRTIRGAWERFVDHVLEVIRRYLVGERIEMAGAA